MKRNTHHYQVGTRDADGLYRSVKVEARSLSEAKEKAVRRSEDLGLYVIAESAKRHPAYG
jgi:hypothetical protein